MTCTDSQLQGLGAKAGKSLACIETLCVLLLSLALAGPVTGQITGAGVEGTLKGQEGELLAKTSVRLLNTKTGASWALTQPSQLR